MQVNWQPIETAPKDGRPILIYVRGPGREGPVGYFDVGRWIEREYFTGGKYWAFNVTMFGDATEWMPLPDPPKNQIVKPLDNPAPAC